MVNFPMPMLYATANSCGKCVPALLLQIIHGGHVVGLMSTILNRIVEGFESAGWARGN